MNYLMKDVQEIIEVSKDYCVHVFQDQQISCDYADTFCQELVIDILNFESEDNVDFKTTLEKIQIFQMSYFAFLELAKQPVV